MYSVAGGPTGGAAGRGQNTGCGELVRGTQGEGGGGGLLSLHHSRTQQRQNL